MGKKYVVMQKIKNIEIMLFILWIAVLSMGKFKLISLVLAATLAKILLALFILALLYCLKEYWNKENDDFKSDISTIMIINIVMVVILTLGIQ
ncbi:MAG: hypothetical protein RSA49_02310 [Anaerovoracaceae bacterium]